MDRHRLLDETSGTAPEGFLITLVRRALDFVPAEGAVLLLDDPVVKQEDRSRNELAIIATAGGFKETITGRKVRPVDGIAGFVYARGERTCVNQVGVNLNTASYHLLAHVSGIGPSMAKSVVEYRGVKGLFRSRQQLLEVPDARLRLALLLAGRVISTVLAEIALFAAGVDLGRDHRPVRDMGVELGLESVVGFLGQPGGRRVG